MRNTVAIATNDVSWSAVYLQNVVQYTQINQQGTYLLVHAPGKIMETNWVIICTPEKGS